MLIYISILLQIFEYFNISIIPSFQSFKCFVNYLPCKIWDMRNDGNWWHSLISNLQKEGVVIKRRKVVIKIRKIRKVQMFCHRRHYQNTTNNTTGMCCATYTIVYDLLLDLESVASSTTQPRLKIEMLRCF